VPDTVQDFNIGVASGEAETVVTVTGEVDMQTAPLLKDRLFELVETGVPRIVVDLGATSFMDSTGLAVLVRALLRMHTQKGELVLRAPQERVRKILRISGLDAVFPQG